MTNDRRGQEHETGQKAGQEIGQERFGSQYDILLVNLYRADYDSSAFRDCIGHYLIAGFLRQHDFRAKVFSGTAEACHSTIQRELAAGRTSLIGFYAAADNIRMVNHAVAWIKREYGDAVKTIIGGPQAIALDTAFFRETGNDFAIIGEGEIPVLRLLMALLDQSLPLERVPSLLYPEPGGNALIWNRADHAVITDLDTLPYPKIDDSLTGQLRNGQQVGIITGRGCPNHCAFCYEGTNSKNVRLRSIGNVMEEIDYMRLHNPRMEFVNVYDDTFTLSRDRVLEFCAAMKERNLRWFCESHISFALRYPDVLRTMVESGLTCIQFGIESGSDKVLEAYHKQSSRDRILSCIKNCKAAGVHNVTGNFIVGGAFEDKDTLQESMELAADMLREGRGIVELNTVYFAPYPNTQMERKPEQFGIQIEPQLEAWSVGSMYSPVVSTRALSAAQIYDKKKEFDQFLREQYRKQAMAARKKDLEQGLFLDGKRSHFNPHWETAYSSCPHIVSFLRHSSAEEQCFSPEKYMIRSFEDFALVDDVLYSDAGCFTDLERDILLNSVGFHNAFSLSEKLGISLDTLRCYYDELNQRCLLYMSRF